MAKKWTNENLPGVLHYVTGNVERRRKIFTSENTCIAFLTVLAMLVQRRSARLICYVLMPDHFHLVVNPQDGDIQAWIGELKSFSAKSIVGIYPTGTFFNSAGQNQVWQQSFKSLPIWSGWMIWQKINYIHNNPLKAGLVRATADYRWSSFRSFYGLDDAVIPNVDEDWWYEDDLEKLKETMDMRKHVC